MRLNFPVEITVRKSAQEKKDKLGPQWSRWVGKAVHKLVGRNSFRNAEKRLTCGYQEAGGLLTTADSNGSVTFTPDGKKA